MILMLFLIAIVAMSIQDTLANIQAFQVSFWYKFKGNKWIDPEVSWRNKYKVWPIFQGPFTCISDLQHFAKSVWLGIFIYFIAQEINKIMIQDPFGWGIVWPVWLCWLVLWFLYGYVFEWFLNLWEEL